MRKKFDGKYGLVSERKIETADSIPNANKGDTERSVYHSIVDYAGREVMASTFGDLIVGEQRNILTASFNYHINPDFVQVNVTGTGAADVHNSRLRLTATGGAGTAKAQSKFPLPYLAGNSNIGLFTCAFDTYKVGTTQKAGLYDDDEGNGYYLTMTATGELAVEHKSNGAVVSTTPQSEFTYDKLDGTGLSGYTMNPQGMNIFRIEYGYLGVAPCIFEIFAGHSIGWIPFHVIDQNGSNSELIIRTPLLSLWFEATSDGTNDITMYSGSWKGGHIGESRHHWNNAQYSLEFSKVGLSTGYTAIISIRVKSVFFGKATRIPIDLHSFNAGLEGNKPHILGLYKNATLGGTPAWNSVNADSVVEYDTAGTLAAASGKLVRALPFGKSDSSEELLEPGEARIKNGETLTLLLNTQATTTDILGSLHWDELH